MKDNKNNKAKIYMIFSLIVLVIVVIVSGTSNNWMKNIVTNNGGNYGWLLTHRPDNSSSTWTVRREGLANNISEASGGLGVVPVLSLSSELGIESGDGSSSNPYKLSA